MTDRSPAENRAAIWKAFGLSEEEWSEFEASPQHQAWLAARADADAQREAWLAWAHERVDELSAEITAKMLAELPRVPRVGSGS